MMLFNNGQKNFVVLTLVRKVLFVTAEALEGMDPFCMADEEVAAEDDSASPYA